MSTTNCRACGAKITFITSKNGKYIPCDISPVYYRNKGNGSSRVVTLTGDVISCEIVLDSRLAEGYGYVPHWSTCKNPDLFRKGY